MQGWLYQAATSVPMYNAVLSIYYLLRVNFKRTDQELRKFALPAMHAAALLWAFGSATAGLVLDIFNFGGLLGCWIYEDYGGYCAAGIDLESCGRGSNHGIFLWLFGAAPVLSSLVVTIAATTAMYCAVRHHEVVAAVRRQRQYHHGVITSGSLELPAVESDDDHENNIATVPVSPTSSQHDEPPAPAPGAPHRRGLRDLCCGCDLSSAVSHKVSAKVRDSGLLYVFAFWVTYLPTMLLEIFFLAGLHSPDWLRIANVTLLSLQGLFNVLIYKVPQWQYLRSQRNNTRSSAISSRDEGRRPHLLSRSTNGQDSQLEQLSAAAATLTMEGGQTPNVRPLTSISDPPR
jgi:hypothetical protein